MPVIHIHCSRLTRRIIEHRHGTQFPIQLRRSDLLYHHLHFRVMDERKTSFAKTKKLLTEKIPVQVMPKLAKYLSEKNRHIRVGAYLHKIALEEMNYFIDALGEAGESRMGALKLFRQKYNIGEDDFAQDSSYKNWQRWENRIYKKNQKKNVPSISNTVLENTMLRDTRKTPPLWSDVVRVISYYYKVGKENLIFQDQIIETCCGTFIRKYDAAFARLFAHPRHMMYYLIYTHCNFTTYQISELFPQSRRHIERSIKTIQDYGILYEQTATEIDELEKILQV